MTVSSARRAGIPVNEEVAQSQTRAIAAYLDGWRERALQGLGIPGDSDTMSAILVGLADAGHKPDPATAATTHFILERQGADGAWRIQAHRPPIESSDFQVTAISLRAIQTYLPASRRSDVQSAIRRAASWLASATPRSNEDRAYQLLGLKWAGTGGEVVRVRSRELIALQHADGGWSQIPSLPSDAYATGEALVALFESGALAPTDPVARKGIDFLLKTQLADGSWFVKTRALRIQPHFESGFPHGLDQFISAAATNWASTALTYAARKRT
jgi:hypothetical protein